MIIPIMPGAPIGTKLERDSNFDGRYPLSVYAATTHQNGTVTDDKAMLVNA